MKMTKLEQAAKDQVSSILNKQGYPTYSRLLDMLDVKLIDTEKEPDAIAYLDVNNATIYLNPNLSINQVSTIVRHEILHEYLTHAARADQFKKDKPQYKNIPFDLINIAADYEISNKGYTDADKRTARGIIIKDKVLKGLVTEDDHPDWINLSFEELLEELAKDQDKYANNLKQIMRDLGIDPPTPQELGDLEDAADQLSDAAEQQAQSASSKSEKDDAEKNKEKADQISDSADNAKQKAEQNQKSKAENNGPFDTDQQQKVDRDTAARADKLRKALDELKGRILSETEYAVDKEKIAKKAADLQKYKDTPLSRFRDSLNQFVKKQTATGRGKSWQRINKKYIGTGLIRAGSSRLAQNYVPLINVYFDVSGSFTGYPEKIKKSEEALGTLNKYVQRGEIKINLYYVTDKVYSDRAEAESHGWGADGRAIIEHVRETKPDNVIVVTDSDSGVSMRDITYVPGAVWILFYESTSNLLEALKGKQLSKQFEVNI